MPLIDLQMMTHYIEIGSYSLLPLRLIVAVHLIVKSQVILLKALNEIVTNTKGTRKPSLDVARTTVATSFLSCDRELLPEFDI